MKAKFKLKINLKLKVLVLNMNKSIIRNEKKICWKNFTVLVIIFFSILPISNFNSFSESDSEENLENRPKMSNGDMVMLVDSEPIHIEGNQGWIDLKNNSKCTGTGVENDPYVIRDIKINGTGYEFGILIEHSSYYFVIDNVDVFNARNYLISLSNTTNGKIVNCRIHDCDQGWGIYLIGSDKNNITSNFIYNTGIDYSGIIILYSDDNTVAFNLLENNGIGIRLEHFCKGNSISKNALSKHYQGIYLAYDADENIIEDNIISNCTKEAFFLKTTAENIISGNMVSDSKFIKYEAYNMGNIVEVNSLNGYYSPIHIDETREKSWFS